MNQFDKLEVFQATQAFWRSGAAESAALASLRHVPADVPSPVLLSHDRNEHGCVRFNNGTG
ncbi:MAG: hypothetical protein RIB55_08275 [Nitratireductor sp.]